MIHWLNAILLGIALRCTWSWSDKFIMAVKNGRGYHWRYKYIMILSWMAVVAFWK